MTREVQSFPADIDLRHTAAVSQQVSKIVQFVRLFHSGQFHGLLVEGSENDGVNLPGPPCFDSLAQAAQNIRPASALTFPNG